jgi:hypothetical protein
VNDAARVRQPLVWIESRWSDQLPAKSGGIVPAVSDYSAQPGHKGRSVHYEAEPGLRKPWENPVNEPG